MYSLKIGRQKLEKDWRLKIARGIGLLAFAAGTPASAQYTYDPSAADEQGPAVRYFGSAKDEKGILLPGVSIQINSPESVYVFVTDGQGRFRANLPLTTLGQAMTAKCFKAGLRQLRVTKRPSSRGPRPTVQLDCILRRTS